jgi:DNA-binding IclR family transcriptional regulator
MQQETVKGGADRVLFVLATLAKMERPATIADLAQTTGLPQSTLYRQLALLKRWGFVFGDQNEYAPGPMCVPLAWGFDQSSFLVQQAHDTLDDMARNSGESIGLLVAVKGQVVCLDMVESTQPLRCSFVKGRSLPLAKGASAKALLAFMSPAHQDATLNRLNVDSVVSAAERRELEQQLAHFRKQGYATSNSEVDAGVWGISAPVYQRAGTHAAAVITLMAPGIRVQGRRQSLVDMTIRGAARISTRLQNL